jgi:hypothetical protein
MATGIQSYESAYQGLCGNKPEHEVDSSRLRATLELVDNSQVLKKAGWQTRTWSPTKQGPAAKKEGWGGYGWDESLIRGWFDHPYRAVNKESGRTLYVSEPYGVTTEGLANLVRISEMGWSVLLDASFALHFPGRTVRVIFEREKAVP